jgi:3-dehydroquinate synthase
MHTAIPDVSHVHIDPTFEALRSWIELKRPTSIVVITDQQTEKHCLPHLTPHLPPGTQFLGLAGHGESIKTLEYLHAIWDSLEGMSMDRNGLIIALGGGTVTDLVAMAAGTYMRGIPFWLIPTTLLGMVDASIGGKTGINFNGLKNRIGTFHNPEGISIHTDNLSSLDPRELRNGWAEHIKHILIHPDALDESMADTLPKLDASIPAAELSHAIATSVGIKWSTVLQDPEEKSGMRKVLNFGHTTGHALESSILGSGGDIKHGEAIAWGMRIALIISGQHASCPQVDDNTYRLVIDFLKQQVPLHCAVPDAVTLWRIMSTDKKNAGGQILMVLLDGPGNPVIDVPVTFEAFEAAHAIALNGGFGNARPDESNAP